MSEHAVSERGALILEPGRVGRHYWRNLSSHRKLFAILHLARVAVRYKQTVIGIAWAVVRPFLTVLVFTMVFGRLAKLRSEGEAPYPLMVFAGVLPLVSVLDDPRRSLEQSRG